MLAAILALTMAATPPPDMDAVAADLVELEGLTWEMERRGMVPPDFGAWQRRVRPGFDWSSPHFELMMADLDRLTTGDIRRLLFEVSVRHGKTETLTGYMAYRLELDPSTRILFGTYSQLQAHKLSRAVRRIAKSQGVAMSPDRDAVSEWETAEGGGLRAVGVGTGVASVNADLIVIDDPIGSRADAESQAHRDMTWDWVTTDILARSEPHTRVAFAMPRWHHDDPAGRLQSRQEGRWRVLHLPALADEGDELGRAEGELLWPSHRPQSWVDDMRVELGPYGFASAVQCRPVPREGALFQRSWFKALDHVPSDWDMTWVRYWDQAGTEGGGKYTAGLLMGLCQDTGAVVVVDVVRGQWAAGPRYKEIRRTADLDAIRFGREREPNRLAVLYVVEQEPGSGGKDSAQQTIRTLAGYRVEAETASGDKFVRADPFAGAAENGDVYVINGAWTEAYLAEMEVAGPGATYLDQMDVSSGAYNRLQRLRDGATPLVGIEVEDLARPAPWAL